MATIMGVAAWPGAVGFISCQYTCSHGITPGIACLEIPEQNVNNLKSYGTLVITDGNRKINLPRCRIVSINYQQSTSGGRSIVLSIADRRWMWQYGFIIGNWNQVDQYPDPSLQPPGQYWLQGGPYVPGTYRLASDLIADCFAAMRETNYLISTPPNVPLPVQWDADNPAQALQGILDHIGYRICYQPATDTVLVAPAGQGRTLPDNLPYTTNHPSVSLPTKPNVIQVVGGDSLFYDQLLLEPVGMDYDGSFKPLDQLSYAPETGGMDTVFGGVLGGWGNCPPSTMGTVQATSQLTKLQAIELAKQYVWRTFRVKMVDVSTGKAPGPNVAGFGPIQARQQIILQPSIVGSTKELNGQPSSKPAFVTGSVYVAGMGGGVNFGINKDIVAGNTAQFCVVPLPWEPTIDVLRQLVMFPRQMFIQQSKPLVFGTFSTKIFPPIIYLYTSFKIQDIIGRVPVKFFFGANYSGGIVSGSDDDSSDIQPGLPELGCPPQVLRHPELIYTSIALRDQNKKVVSLTDNLTDLTSTAQYYLDSANAQYNPQLALDRTYGGVWPISPDGAIRQVTWRVGGGQPATTQASMNSEHNFFIPQYPERRRNEAAKQWADKEAERQLRQSNDLVSSEIARLGQQVARPPGS